MSDDRSSHIVIVDDSESSIRVIESLLTQERYSRITTTTDSTTVVELFETGAPDLLLLDLQMPAPDGFAVMRLIEPWTTGDTYVPVLVLTADVDRATRRRALAAGARDFLTKPFDLDEVSLRIRNLLRTRQLQLALQAQTELLEDRVLQRTLELESSRAEAYEKLALASEYRDDETRQHTRRVGALAGALASALGIAPADLAEFSRAASLHDIGKIGIPDSILLKPGALTEQEAEVMRTHAQIGADILSGSASPLFTLAAEIALNHHEHWDGTGCPRGLSRESIPLAGRIVALADAFDAMGHRRPYKQAMPLDEILAEIARCSGTHFDPAVVAALDRRDHETVSRSLQETAIPA